jgi:hypothetical protein
MSEYRYDPESYTHRHDHAHDRHDPTHVWTADHHHPWGEVDHPYVIWEPYHLEHTHDGARSAQRLREPTT